MSLGDVIPPTTQDDSHYFFNFSVEPNVFYKETPLLTQDMLIQFELSPTMERWEFLRHEDNMTQEAPAPASELIAPNENKLLQWSNGDVEEIENYTFHDWMGLSFLKEEPPILVKARVMQGSGNDKLMIKN